MEVWDAITTQRAVREFDARPLDPEALHRIVDAGRRAPSSMNEQRWTFIVCTDPARLLELSKLGDYAEHLAGAGAAVALVTPEAEEAWQRESIAYDLGQATQSMMITAWDLGIGSVHASVYDEALARRLLAYPDGFRCEYVVSFGYPADPSVLTRPQAEAARKPWSEAVREDRW